MIIYDGSVCRNVEKIGHITIIRCKRINKINRIFSLNSQSVYQNEIKKLLSENRFF